MGHLSILQCARTGNFIYFVGSKNVHIAIQNKDDIESFIDYACTNTSSRSDSNNNGYSITRSSFRGAKLAAYSIMNALESLEEEKRLLLCKFLSETRITASFEILSIHQQHVVYLNERVADSVDKSIAVLFGFSLPVLRSVKGAELCLNPVLWYEFAKAIGLQTVQYHVFDYTNSRYKKYQTCNVLYGGYEIEGCVDLFIDHSGHVIGIEKFKSVWYVSLRAIREKAKSFVSKVINELKNGQFSGGITSKENLESKVNEHLKAYHQLIHRKFISIRSFLNIVKEVSDVYSTWGIQFLDYLANQYIYNNIMDNNSNSALDKSSMLITLSEVLQKLTEVFPLVWMEFKEHGGLEDRVDWCPKLQDS